MAELVHLEPQLAVEPEPNSVAQVALHWQPDVHYLTVLLRDAAAVPQPEEPPQSAELEPAALAL